MKTIFILSFILLLLSFHSHAQQTIDKLNVNQLKLPKESANKALILDGAGQVKSSSTITDTELGYLEGLTDTLVNLLSGKANDGDVVKLTGNQNIDGVKTFEGKLVASSTVNGSIPCPVMTEAQRDLFTPVEGDCVYNSDTLKLNVFDGSVWKDVGGAGGISLWLTANPYNVNDIIIESDKIYRCLIAHTSGTFATDLAASKWIEVSSGLQSPVALADGGTGVAITPIAGSIVYVDADSFEQVSGTAGQVLQSNGSGAPTFVNKSISAKSLYGSSVTAEEIQVPNNLLTQVDTNKHLNETGNKNILINPSFEHSTFSTGWTNSAGTFTEDTIVEIDGLKAAKLVLSSQTMSLSQSSTLYASQFADGVQGLASVRVKSDVALKVCSIQAGVVSTANCVDVQANNKWGLYKVPMILGATSNGISIASTGSVSGTVYIDDAFVGAVDLQASSDSSRFFGSLKYAGTTNCSWTTSSITTTDFAADTDCSIPTVSGNASAPATKIPQIDLSGMTPGKEYLVIAKFVGSKSSTTNGAYFELSDSLNNQLDSTYQFIGTGGSVSQWIPNSLIGRFIATGSSVSFKIRARSESTGNTSIEAFNAQTNLEFIVYEYGQRSTYSSTNADFGWTDYIPTVSNLGAGSGTIVGRYKRQGDSAIISIRFIKDATNGAGSNSVQFSLPTGLSVDATKTSGDISFVGTGYVSNPTVAVNHIVSYWSIANNRIQLTNSNNAILGSSVIAGTAIELTIMLPIEGWQQSNIIIGQFNGLESCTDSYQCEDTYSAKFSSTGVTSEESLDWINGNASVSGGNVYTIPFKTGLFTVSPNCVFVSTANNSLAHTVQVSVSSTQLVVASSATNTGSASAGSFSVICQKQGVDYIGKTAKAVASDQNVRTPGIVNAKSISFQYAGSSSGPVTPCTTTNCVINNSYGATGVTVTRTATAGKYLISFPAGMWTATPNCTCSSFINGANTSFCQIGIDSNNSTGKSLWSSNPASPNATIDSAGEVVCHGYGN